MHIEEKADHYYHTVSKTRIYKEKNSFKVTGSKQFTEKGDNVGFAFTGTQHDLQGTLFIYKGTDEYNELKQTVGMLAKKKDFGIILSNKKTITVGSRETTAFQAIVRYKDIYNGTEQALVSHTILFKLNIWTYKYRLTFPAPVLGKLNNVTDRLTGMIDVN